VHLCFPSVHLQVLDFITSLTISVHADLPEEAQRVQQAPVDQRSRPLGPAQLGFPTALQGDQQQQATYKCGSEGCMAALGAPLDISALQMRREQRQQRKKPDERRVPIFVVPAPASSSLLRKTQACLARAKRCRVGSCNRSNTRLPGLTFAGSVLSTIYFSCW